MEERILLAQHRYHVVIWKFILAFTDGGMDSRRHCDGKNPLPDVREKDKASLIFHQLLLSPFERSLRCAFSLEGETVRLPLITESFTLSS